jgi:hypothetical protein
MRIVSVGNPTHGQVGLHSRMDGSGQMVTEVVFIPDANFHGVASFSYTVMDQAGLTATATASLQIQAVNDTPIAQSDTMNLSEDRALFVNPADLLMNDSDWDGATDGQLLTVTAVSEAEHGQVEMLASGGIRFVPEVNFHGLARFTYTCGRNHQCVASE